jgi:hypothetical protein
LKKVIIYIKIVDLANPYAALELSACKNELGDCKDRFEQSANRESSQIERKFKLNSDKLIFFGLEIRVLNQTVIDLTKRVSDLAMESGKYFNQLVATKTGMI